MKPKTPSAKANSGPCGIAKILDNVLPLKHGGTPEKRSAEYKPKNSIVVHQKADEGRIVKLEQQLEYLGRQIEKIAQTINAELPSK